MQVKSHALIPSFVLSYSAKATTEKSTGESVIPVTVGANMCEHSGQFPGSRAYRISMKLGILDVADIKLKRTNA